MLVIVLVFAAALGYCQGGKREESDHSISDKGTGKGVIRVGGISKGVIEVRSTGKRLMRIRDTAKNVTVIGGIANKKIEEDSMWIANNETIR